MHMPNDLKVWLELQIEELQDALRDYYVYNRDVDTEDVVFLTTVLTRYQYLYDTVFVKNEYLTNQDIYEYIQSILQLEDRSRVYLEQLDLVYGPKAFEEHTKNVQMSIAMRQCTVDTHFLDRRDIVDILGHIKDYKELVEAVEKNYLDDKSNSILPQLDELIKRCDLTISGWKELEDWVEDYINEAPEVDRPLTRNEIKVLRDFILYILNSTRCCAI